MTDALKQATQVIFALDVAVSLLWLINSFLTVGFDCWDQLLVHIVVGVHFGVQTVCFAFLIDDGVTHELEVDERSASRDHRLLPRRFPAAWITASVYALFGDFSLIALDVHHLKTDPFTDQCRGVIIYELFIESCVTFVAILSICWYVALAIERHVKRKRNEEDGLVSRAPNGPAKTRRHKSII